MRESRLSTFRRLCRFSVRFDRVKTLKNNLFTFLFTIVSSTVVIIHIFNGLLVCQREREASGKGIQHNMPFNYWKRNNFNLVATTSLSLFFCTIVGDLIVFAGFCSRFSLSLSAALHKATSQGLRQVMSTPRNRPHRTSLHVKNELRAPRDT